MVGDFFAQPPSFKEIYVQGGTGIVNVSLAKPYKVGMCDTSSLRRSFPQILEPIALRTHNSPRYKFHFKGELLTTVE